ncbi:MAG: mandelate racemase/muconate lactonizing enzyme family protein [Armatimonadetes bacterium]|nr:mandelate racemase/muconate lactonizing enzyme family protein [Armatimonadota bacterium]MCX7967223.1 mandelate racemase/muconate lactonizing enzyme family protein [Armatimonadota bacterium]MDW8143244.1 mandelate racemase/muconate lactonizing enzyme family protein [Armatimonadota bacterium]
MTVKARIVGVAVYFLPIKMRMPLKFGKEVVEEVVCCRVKMKVADEKGNTADGWGETPLIAQWGWASEILPYSERLDVMKSFCLRLAKAWVEFDETGHAFEIGHAFLSQVLPLLLMQLNNERTEREPMPYLAALICNSPFDIALHDAYGNLVGLPVYETYRSPFMSFDLSAYLEPEKESVNFKGKFPADFLSTEPPRKLPVWHLVGAKDPLTEDDLTGSEPDDGYPVLLRDWILRDGLKCLKVKLTGTDFDWDYERLVRVGQIALAQNVMWLTADFNCTVTDPQYVVEFLDKLLKEHPRFWQMLLYIEQPFPYEIESYPIDVRTISARKPLFMDESAHDWKFVRMGRKLGWTGVALKTCKTQTGALLMQAWAKAHGMLLMVQDLTNPMLALIPHVLLAAYSDTIMGVEANAMQFYPQASEPESKVHQGLYRRRDGCVDWSTIKGSGFGYRLKEIKRVLPEPALQIVR